MTVSKKKKAVIDEIESIKLDEVTEEQIVELLFPKRKAFVTVYKHKAAKVTCSCCGHEWHTFAPAEVTECPHCHKPLEIEFVGAGRKKWESDWLVAIKFEAHGEYQFVRYFYGRLWGILGNEEHIIQTYETHRFVYDRNGEIWLFRRNVAGSYYRWWFSYFSDIKYQPYVKSTSYRTTRYWLNYSAVFPNPTYTEPFRYCRAHLADVGNWLDDWLEPFAKGNAEQCRFLETVAQIERGPSKFWELIASNHCPADFRWFYNHAKIVLRALSTDYPIIDHEWVENINDLNSLGMGDHMDLIFPDPEMFDATRKKVCRMVERNRIAIRMREIEDEERKMLPTALKYQPQYEKAHKRFFEVHVEGNGMVITPLKSVQAFFDEGITMGHCVFRCEYFKRPELQIYSVRDAVTNERIETLSLDIDNRTIQQCYGKHDTKSKRHDDIIALVKANMDALLPKGRRSQA